LSKCKGSLNTEKLTLRCDECSDEYQIWEGIPILINDSHSFLKTKDIIMDVKTTTPQKSDCLDTLRFLHRLFWKVSFKVVPHLYSKRRMKEIASIFNRRIEAYKNLNSFETYRFLIVGGGNRGNIGREIKISDNCELINSDVYYTSTVNLIADVTLLPFADSSFDFVLAEGVLEHVVSPVRGVEEIHRILKPDGLIFVTSPLMLGVHMPGADFTRWTKSGLVALFRNFDILESGVIDGAFVALAYQLSYIAMLLSPKKILKFVNLFVNLMLFPLKYIDPLFRRVPLAEDVACSLYMIARKSETIIDDDQIIDSFTGAGFCPY
jgi:SAM-dependent methyltransferase